LITDTWTEGIRFAAGGCVWVFPKEEVVFTEITVTAPTPSDAGALIDMFLWLGHELGTDHEPTIVHDWRSIRSIPKETRQTFQLRRREIRMRPKRLVVAADLNPLTRMVMRTVALGAQLVSGAAPIELVKDPRLSLAELGVKSPDPALHARLRSSFRHPVSAST
jgi:hypothetical protein